MGFKHKLAERVFRNIFQRCEKKFIARKGQTASELAIFGAILIFVLGLIIRYAVNFNYTQNQSYEAMRLAMQQSFIASESSKNSSRNVASILFVEDRKDPDLSGETGVKYGVQTRTPYIISGSGTMTKNLFMFTDWNYPEDLPVMDVFINGKHFTFTTSAFKEYTLLIGNNANVYPNSGVPGIPYDSDEHCYRDAGGDHRCVDLYSRITPGYRYGTFCTDYTVECNKRFDLDRNPRTDCSGSTGDPHCTDGADVPCGLIVIDVATGVEICTIRRDFAWQWALIKATNKSIDIDKGKNVSLDVNGDLKEEQVLGFDTGVKGCNYGFDPKKKSTERNIYSRFDPCTGTSAITKIRVIDPQAGDLALDYNSWDALGMPLPSTGGAMRNPPPSQPGLMEDSSLYVYDHGAYLMLEQGKLYGSDHQFVRSTTRKDKVDLIERKIRLSNNTGRLCQCADYNDPATCTTLSSDNLNVEACMDCFSNANMQKTCYDSASKILYVRSNIGDQTGQKWITDINTDKNPLITK